MRETRNNRFILLFVCSLACWLVWGLQVASAAPVDKRTGSAAAGYDFLAIRSVDFARNESRLNITTGGTGNSTTTPDVWFLAVFENNVTGASTLLRGTLGNGTNGTLYSVTYDSKYAPAFEYLPELHYAPAGKSVTVATTDNASFIVQGAYDDFPAAIKQLTVYTYVKSATTTIYDVATVTYSLPPPAPGPTPEPTPEEEGLPDWVYVSLGLNMIIGFFVPFCCLMAWEGMKLRTKECWYVYRLHEQQGKRWTGPLHAIGEYVGMREDREKNRYELCFRHNFRYRYYYSLFGKDLLKSSYLVQKYLWYHYALNLVESEKVLPEAEWFKRRSQMPIYAYVLETIQRFFSLSKGAEGLAGICIITALTSISNQFNAIAVWVGFGVSVLVVLVMTLLFSKGVLSVKLKEELVETETWLDPLLPNVVVEDLYEVELERQVEVQNEDATMKKQIVEAVEKATFEQIVAWQNDKRVSILSYKQVGTRERMYEVHELLSLSREFVVKVRSLWERIHDLNAQVARLQGANTQLNLQLQNISTEMDQKLSEFNQTLLAERDAARDDLKSLMVRVVGEDVVNNDWHETVKAAIVESKMRKERVVLDQLRRILQLQVQLLERTNGNAGAGMSLAALKKELGLIEVELPANPQT